ncbi:MAG: hypothetical protein HUK20_01030 [Fibrobacter sp.]|nr:hypothetical protein [Fibrobacter sp.]
MNLDLQKLNRTPRKTYQKACMTIVEIDAVDVLTQSGEQTRQLQSFQKQRTDEWF